MITLSSYIRSFDKAGQ